MKQYKIIFITLFYIFYYFIFFITLFYIQRRFMFSKLILYTFIVLFIFILFNELFSQSSLIEGLTTDESSNDNDLGITVGRYTSKIDQLGKTIDSMQATILGLLPTVTKNAQDNANNQQAIQAIIANKNKT